MYSASQPLDEQRGNRAHPRRNNVSQHAEPKTIIPPAGPAFMTLPLVIARNLELSGNAKLLYSRLMLYAGKNGICTPSHETLAAEIGVKERQVRNILAELKGCSLVSWHRRRTSSSYTVNPPELFKSPERQNIAEHGRQVIAGLERQDVADKKMSLNRGSVKDVALDCATLTHRAVNVPRKPLRKIQQYPNLRKLLAQFMANMQALRPEHYPSHEQVAELVHACEVEGLGESWIQNELAFLYNTKGIRYGVTGGPYSFKWFIATLSGRASDEIERRDARSEVAWDHEGMRMVS